MEANALILSTSPHIKSTESVPKIMISVIITLVPAVAFSIYQYGSHVLYMYLVSIATCLATEYVVVRLRKRPISIADYSSVVTKFPLFGVVLGAVVAIVIGKQIFGGIGYNIFNPALIGRAFLAATYPVLISSYSAPKVMIDAITGATPLAMIKFDGVLTPLSGLFFGTVNGSIGESSAILIIVGSIYLFIKKYIKWRIPASIIITVIVLGEIFYLINPVKYPGPVFHVLAGGLMIGALYMATDMVTSPITRKGCVIFGIGIGTLVMVIRLFGGLPEGVMYSILLMNAFVPLINRGTKPRIFGTGAANE